MKQIIIENLGIPSNDIINDKIVPFQCQLIESNR